MNDEIEIKLIEQCRLYKTSKATSLGAHAACVDTTRYVSENRLEQEKKALFSQLPSILVHVSELTPKQNLVPVESLIGPLVIAQDEQGEISVFRNACRHRGAKLVHRAECNRLMVCPYHAWAYNTSGELVSVPSQQQCFPDLNKDENGLIKIPSTVRFGFVWICPSVAQNQSVDEHLNHHLGEMVSHLEWLNAAQLRFFKRSSQQWSGNWKLFAEGGLETYHFSFAHKDTIAKSFYNNTAVVDQINNHFRVIMPTRELDVGNPTSLRDCSHILLFLLPNSALLVQKEHVDWIQFEPLSPSTTRIHVASLIPDNTNLDDPSQVSHWHKSHHITKVTLDEDWALGESIQSSLMSKSLPHIQYGKNEWALHSLNQIIEQILSS